MSIDEIAGVIVAATAVLAAAATIAAAFSGMRGLRNQLWLQTFSDYTKRYSDIMDVLPFDARRPGSDFDIESLDEAGRLKILGAFRRYFNLCSEEFWLWRLHRIDDDTWRVWKVGIAETTKFPSATYAWNVLRCEYEYFAEFIEFMEHELLVTASPVKTTATDKPEDRPPA